MRKKRRIILISLLIALLGGFAWLVLNLGEPVYRGRTLDSWLVQYRTNESIDPEAETAIRAIGKDAIPRLLSMLGTKDTAIRRGLKKLSENFEWLPIHLRDREELLELASGGFAVLGPNAKPAVPALIRYLRSTDSDIRANTAYSLAKIGSDAAAAVPDLINNLGNISKTNTANYWAQAESACTIYALGQMGAASRPAIPLLNLFTNQWTNYPGTVGSAAYAALIKIRGDSMQPFLDLLKNTSDETNWAGAIRTMYSLGTNDTPVQLLNLGYATFDTGSTNQLFIESTASAGSVILTNKDVYMAFLPPFAPKKSTTLASSRVSASEARAHPNALARMREWENGPRAGSR